MPTTPQIALAPPAPPDPFRKAFRQSLIFCILAPTVTGIAFGLVSGMIAVVLQSQGWALINEATRTFARWPTLLATITCATLWALVHLRRKTLMPPGWFFALALLPLVAAWFLAGVPRTLSSGSSLSFVEGLLIVIALLNPAYWWEISGYIGAGLSRVLGLMSPDSWAGLCVYLALAYATPRVARRFEAGARGTEGASLTPPPSAAWPPA